MTSLYSESMDFVSFDVASLLFLSTSLNYIISSLIYISSFTFFYSTKSESLPSNSKINCYSSPNFSISSSLMGGPYICCGPMGSLEFSLRAEIVISLKYLFDSKSCLGGDTFSFLELLLISFN